MTRNRILQIAATRGTVYALKVARLCQEQHLIAAVQNLIDAPKRVERAKQAARGAEVYRKVGRKIVFSHHVGGNAVLSVLRGGGNLPAFVTQAPKRPGQRPAAPADWQQQIGNLTTVEAAKRTAALNAARAGR